MERIQPTRIESSTDFFENPINRSAAYVITAFAIGALAVVHGTPLITAWIGGPTLIFLGRDIYLTVQDIYATGLTESADKIKDLAYRAFVFGIVWGVLLTGICFAHTYHGVVSLLTGSYFGDAVVLLESLYLFAGIAGVWGPLSQAILNTCDHYFFPRKQGDGLAQPIDQWVDAILEALRTYSLNPVWSRMAVDSNFISYLPVNLRQEMISQELPRMSHEQIQTLILRFPYVMQIDFLEKHLTPAQFQASVEPLLITPQIDVATIDAQLKELENKSDSVIHHWIGIIGQLENIVKFIDGWDVRLGDTKQPLKESIRSLKEEIKSKNIRSRIEALKKQILLPKEDIVAFLQTECGFTAADLKSLEGLFYESKPLNELLYARGLRREHDLKSLKIVESDNTPALIRRRLRNHFNHPPLPSLKTASILSRLVPWEAISHKVKVVANYIFYYGFTLSMLGLQSYYFPIATALGLGYGLYRKERFHSLEQLSSWETVPDFTGQSIGERCRFIWSRTSATIYAIQFGAPSAFLTGIYLADTLRHYTGPQAAAIQQRLYTVISMVVR